MDKLSIVSTLTERISAAIAAIPHGRVCTYGTIAAIAGNPQAARQVVRVLHSRSEKLGLPWHRVVNRDGGISLPLGSGGSLQKGLLESEGIEFRKNGSVDLERYLWKG